MRKQGLLSQLCLSICLVDEDECFLYVETGSLALLICISWIEDLASPLSTAFLLAHEVHEFVGVVFDVELELPGQILFVDEVGIKLEQGIEEGQLLLVSSSLSLLACIIAHVGLAIDDLFQVGDRLLDEVPLGIGTLHTIKQIPDRLHGVYFKQGSKVLKYLNLHRFLGLRDRRHPLKQRERVRAHHFERSLVIFHSGRLRVLSVVCAGQAVKITTFSYRV